MLKPVCGHALRPSYVACHRLHPRDGDTMQVRLSQKEEGRVVGTVAVHGRTWSSSNKHSAVPYASLPGAGSRVRPIMNIHALITQSCSEYMTPHKAAFSVPTGCWCQPVLPFAHFY